MRIIDLSLFVIELPFRFTFTHNLAKRSCSQNLIVKATIESKQGISIGYGEGVPREYVTGENIEQAVVRLKNEYFARFAGKEFSDTNDLISYITQQFYSLGLDQSGGSASWCALELALLDAAARAEKMPVSQLLSADHTFANSIKYGATASLTGKIKLIGLLTFFKLYGFSTVKLKVGNNLDDSIERIRLARKIMGDTAIIRVDANCAWTISETIEFSKRAEIYNIASIEQPIEPGKVENIVELASQISQALVLDESLCTIQQAKYFAAQGVNNIDFNIRISKMGGLLASNTIKNIAKESGINCHLGAQVGESGILTAAGRIFALSKGSFLNYEGSANNLLLKHDITNENLTFGYGGWGKLPNGNYAPGLGVTVNLDKLKKLTVENENTIIAQHKNNIGDALTEDDAKTKVGSKQ